MTAVLSNFTSEIQVGTGSTSLVSTTADETKFLGAVTFTNTSSSAVLVTVYRILTATPISSGSGGNWIDRRSIQPGKVWKVDKLESQVLSANMSIFATAATANVINADLSGVTET
jgi:hypothetical protein